MTETAPLPTVDRLLLAHAGEPSRVLLLDPSPALLAACEERFDVVATFNDDVRSAEADEPLAFTELAELADIEPFDLALGRLHQNLNALDQVASELASVGVRRYVASANTKHMTPHQNDVLAHSFGEVSATLGMGKYRALVAEGPLGHMPRVMDRNEDEALGLVLVADGRVFAGPALDQGTALLLQTASRWPVGDAVDVGCGNGIIAATLSELGNQVTGIDVSLAALRSTEATFDVNQLDEPDLIWGDGLAALEDHSVDVIVTNPPFHVGTTKDSSPTIAFLRDAPRVLREGGELWCVFNAHLPYVDILREGFARVEIIRRDANFIVARAR